MEVINVKSGMVAMIGRPNVGKSTLMNSILGCHLAITSDKVGTTRNVIEGIYEDENSQIVFVDTPGISKPMDHLGGVLNKKSYSSFDMVDVVLFLVDASKGYGKGDAFILNRLKEEDIPVFLVLNKIDLVKRAKLLEMVATLKDIYPFQEIIPVSALTEDNTQELIGVLKNYLPNEGRIFESDTLTNISTKFYVAEIVREKVLLLTEEEVPHSVSCLVEEFHEEKEKVVVRVLIIVDRDSLKKIIIGKNGAKIKEIGILARRDLEEYFGKKVYLETFVKTLKNWRDKEKYLKELGIDE